MSGFEAPVPSASSMESPTIRAFQGVVHNLCWKISEDHVDEAIGDLVHGHRTRTLQEPAVRMDYAVPHGDDLERFSASAGVHYCSAYVNGRYDMRGMPRCVLRAWFSTSISGDNDEGTSTLHKLESS